MKHSQKEARFSEIVRYLTLEEYRRLIDGVDHRVHRLMFEMIYELGCRVGEFVRVRLADIDFSQGMVFFPAENTKTRQARWSVLPQRVLSEIKAMLKEQGRMRVRTHAIKKPHEYLFSPDRHYRRPYTENRVRQIFRKYIQRAGLDRTYGNDSQDRQLHQFTVHSLRHAHVMHHIHDYKLPLPIVQKQVGHKTLKATSVYLNPSAHLVARAYRTVEPMRSLQSPEGANAGQDDKVYKLGRPYSDAA